MSSPPLALGDGDSAQRVTGHVHHLTGAAYSRGVEAMMGTYQFLDLAPWGRNENELEFAQAWWRRHDEYGLP